MNVFHHHNCNCLFFQQECGIRLEQCINDWLSLTKTALKILSLVIYSWFVISVFKNLGSFKQHHWIIWKTEVVKMQLIFQNGRSHIKVMMDIQYVWFKCSMIIICQNDTGCPKKNFPLAHFRVFEHGRGVFRGKK